MPGTRYVFESNFDLTRFGPAFDRESLVSMEDVCKIVEASVAVNMPRSAGVAQGSIEQKVLPLTDATQGEVFSNDDEAKIATLEVGRAAGLGFPNIDQLQRGMIAKGIDLKKTFIVARAIAEHGTPARHVFKKSWEETEQDVDRILLDLLPEKIIQAI